MVKYQIQPSAHTTQLHPATDRRIDDTNSQFSRYFQMESTVTVDIKTMAAYFLLAYDMSLKPISRLRRRIFYCFIPDTTVEKFKL